MQGEGITDPPVREKLNIFTNIPPTEANSTDFKPLAVWLQDYLKKTELCTFTTLFSMHMQRCLVHNVMTTTLVTECRSCVAVVADKPAASSKQLFCGEGGKSAAERIGFSVTHYTVSI